MTSYELNICAPFILETYIRADGRIATRATKYLEKEILVVDEGYLNANNTVKRLANELFQRGWRRSSIDWILEKPIKINE